MVIQGGNKSSIFKASTQISRIECLQKNKVSQKDQQENQTNIGNQNYKKSSQTNHLPNK
jgi:hypothetical protein